ncbi:tyrosine-protein phosphatase, partial [Klebsiella pneumoniae]|uniref:tyrosine-protein phosphatase n=1 Tax=Klebsiella pneumoniae TaxID=573 RepID=UPI003218587D
ERMARRLPLLAKAIEEISGQTPEDEAVMTAMGVETHYLETAFREIDSRFGDLDGYLEHALGVGPPARERIAERLDAWRETPVTTLVLGTPQPEALQTLAELVL